MSSLIRELVFLEGDSLVVYYYPSVFEIWPDKRGDLWWKWPYYLCRNVSLSLFITIFSLTRQLAEILQNENVGLVMINIE